MIDWLHTTPLPEYVDFNGRRYAVTHATDSWQADGLTYARVLTQRVLTPKQLRRRAEQRPGRVYRPARVPFDLVLVDDVWWLAYGSQQRMAVWEAQKRAARLLREREAEAHAQDE